ncbi:SCO0930 family lipoprotein [soil metagenome]
MTSRRNIGVAALAVLAATASGTIAFAGTDTTEPSASASESSGDLVQTAESDLGPILVDASGMTLYAFLPDAAGAPTCEGDCAANWPPLMASDIGDLDPALFSIVEHADGSMLAVNGWPLYLFANDVEPGETNGQGLGDVWFVVAPDGTPVGAPDADGSAPFVQTAESDLGTILVGADGMTLYAFLPDDASAATCEGECADNWPPLFVGGSAGEPATSEPAGTDPIGTDPHGTDPIGTDPHGTDPAVSGPPTEASGLADLDFGDLDAALFSVVEHADGPMLAINGWPLYNFAGDAEPGDTNGQGLGDVWFVVAPDGSPIGAPGADTADSTATSTEPAGY